MTTHAQNKKNSIYHFVILFNCVFPAGGLFGLLLLRLIRKFIGPEERFHFNSAMNFQLSIFIYTIALALFIPRSALSSPIFIFGMAAFYSIFAVINSVRAFQGLIPVYPSIEILRARKKETSPEELMYNQTDVKS